MKIWVSLFTLLQIVINGQLPEKNWPFATRLSKTQSHCQFSLSSSRSRAFSCRVISLGNGVFTPGVIRARLRQTRNAQYMLIQCFTVRHSFRRWWSSDLGGTTAALRLPLERWSTEGPSVCWILELAARRVAFVIVSSLRRPEYSSSAMRLYECWCAIFWRSTATVRRDLLWTSSPARRCVWKRSLLL